MRDTVCCTMHMVLLCSVPQNTGSGVRKPDVKPPDELISDALRLSICQMNRVAEMNTRFFIGGTRYKESE